MTDPTSGRAVVRVYVPTTLTGLALLTAQGYLDAPAAYAPTARLRAGLALPADADDDELAEAAVVAAGDACLPLLAAEAGAVPLRVVVAADVVAVPAPDTEDEHPAAVVCRAPVRLADVAAVLADDDTASGAVAAAVAAWRMLDSADRSTPPLSGPALVRDGAPADEGGADPDRERAYEAALDALDDHSLSWFDTSEIPLLARHRPPLSPEGTASGH